MSQAGACIASILEGSWRRHPPPVAAPPPDLRSVLRQLVASGAAGLAWRRLSRDCAVDAEALETLHDAARSQALRETMQKLALRHVLALFNAAGVTPVLLKGAAVARFYAETYLRPYGDFDLLVPPDQMPAARAVLDRHADPRTSQPWLDKYFVGYGVAGKACQIDLHESASKFGVDNAVLLARARPADLAEGNCRVPAPEDHLRIVIVHLLIHGAWRPLWLCDVAAIVEGRPADFDWNACLSDDPKTARWISAVIALAERLLGYDTAGLPEDLRAQGAPEWLVATTLREWERPFPSRFKPAKSLAPRHLVDQLRARWPNAIRASFRQGAEVRSRGRAWRQLTSYGGELTRVAARLVRTGW